MRLSWALVHSRQPEDVNRGIAMLEAALDSSNSPLQMREKLYLLPVGHYRSGDYSRSRQLLEKCLELKDMAERLPGGAARNSGKLPSLTSFSPSSVSSDFSVAATDQMSNLIAPHESDSNGGTNGAVTNGPTSNNHHQNRVGIYSVVVRNGSKLPDADSNHESEWVEQDEPGVYITLTSLTGAVKDLKRVRFRRKRFIEKQAEQWWGENRARVYEQYNARMVDNRSAICVGNE